MCNYSAIAIVFIVLSLFSGATFIICMALLMLDYAISFYKKELLINYVEAKKMRKDFKQNLEKE